MRDANPRPRKYASAAERQAAYRARLEDTGIVSVSTRFERRTAETLERISAERLMPVNELVRQIVLHSLANNDWRVKPLYTRPLTAQATDDRRRATKFQPIEDDEGDDDA
jgi:hypothetical protein